MSFFRGFNFARFIILLSYLGAIPLGWNAWEQFQKNEEMKAALARGGEVERQVDRIRESSQVYTKLMAERRGEGLIGADADVQSYIIKKAYDDAVELGDINISVGSPRGIGKGVREIRYEVEPSDRERSFQRTSIANFLYILEQDTQRLKVTDLTLNIDQKGLKPEQIPDRDYWKFDATVTTRQKVD